MRMVNPSNRGMLLYRIFAVLLLTLGTLPISINLISPGLDMSGMYLLNIMGEMGLKFGTDLIFPYGPLGFLQVTHNIGNNAQIALAFYGILTVAEIWLLWCTFRRQRGRRGALLIGLTVVVFLCGVSHWQPDYYICFLVFLAISLAWTEQHPHRYLIFASALTVLAALIKFNTGIQCMITLVLFVAGKLLLEKRKALRFVQYLPAVAATYVVAFLYHNPSLSALGHYMFTNLEISSGYNTALSVVPDAQHLLAAVLCGGCFCVFLVLIFFADFISGIYLFVFSGALFQCFKHGFVRADAHIYIFFVGFLMIVTIISLFLDYDRLLPALQRIRARAICCASMAAIMLLIPLYVLNPSVQGITNLFPAKINGLCFGIPARLETKIEASNVDILPDEILKIIGQDTVAVMPWESSIDAYNDINMVVMPVIQSLLAHTPALDAENAAFFIGDAAPEYIIFATHTIDGRVPLLEIPATWQALYENYNAVLQEGMYLLLKKADTPYIPELGEANIQTVSSGAQIALPEMENGALLYVKAELTLWGKLNKFFYQVPPVTITLTWSDGTQSSGRVLPEVLENGIMLDMLPDSLSSMCLTMNSKDDGKKVVSFQLGGEGWRYYQDTMTVSFQTVLSQKTPYTYFPYGTIEVVAVDNPTVNLIAVDVPRTLWVDFLNGAPLQAESSANTATGILISGWALDDPLQLAAEAVYLQFDGQYYKLHQTDRRDVAETFFGNQNSPMCGFEGWLPLEGYVAGSYPANLIVICDGGSAYYSAHITSITVTNP